MVGKINHRDGSLRSGFLLFESLIYIASSLIIIGLMASGIITLYKGVESHITALHSILENVIVAERISSDIKMASCNSFKYTGKNSFVFATNFADVGWEYKNNMFVRYEGIFNVQNKNWYKKFVSVAAQHILDSRFLYSKSGSKVWGVEIDFGLKCFASPRIGRIL